MLALFLVATQIILVFIFFPPFVSYRSHELYISCTVMECNRMIFMQGHSVASWKQLAVCITNTFPNFLSWSYKVLCDDTELKYLCFTSSHLQKRGSFVLWFSGAIQIVCAYKGQRSLNGFWGFENTTAQNSWIWMAASIWKCHLRKMYISINV